MLTGSCLIIAMIEPLSPDFEKLPARLACLRGMNCSLVTLHLAVHTQLVNTVQ